MILGVQPNIFATKKPILLLVFVYWFFFCPLPSHPYFPASPLSSPGTGIPSSLTRCEATTLSCYATSRCATSVTWWWKTRKSSLASSKTQNNTRWLFVGHYFLFTLWGEKPHERRLTVEFPFVRRTESGALLCVRVCLGGCSVLMIKSWLGRIEI